MTELQASNADHQAAAGRSGGTVQQGAPINQRFRSLDEYLAHLERVNAPIDKPWYREVRPGIYQLQTGGNLHLPDGNPPPRTFTREELEQKFGFSS